MFRLLSLFLLFALGATGQARLDVTHIDRPMCTQWLRFAAPGGGCVQSVMVFVTGAEPGTRAYAITLAFTDSSGNPRAIERIVRVEGNQAATLFYDLPDIRIRQVIAEPLRSSGSTLGPRFLKGQKQ